MTLSNLEDHFLLPEIFVTNIPRINVLTAICLHIDRKANMACNFNSLIEIEGLIKLTALQRTFAKTSRLRISSSQEERHRNETPALRTRLTFSH